ncbi:hypothetical protein LY76DRAFT_629452 [Colletotrichum caudatum]|nr:hypothetical protein LY76DRAFT_629452 [Colletotrichum caudatum]
MSLTRSKTPRITDDTELDRALALFVHTARSSICEAWDKLTQAYIKAYDARRETLSPFPEWVERCTSDASLVRFAVESTYKAHWEKQVKTNRNEAAYRTRAASQLGLKSPFDLYLWYGPVTVASRNCWQDIPKGVTKHQLHNRLLAQRAESDSGECELQTPFTVKEFTAAKRSLQPDSRRQALASIQTIQPTSDSTVSGGKESATTVTGVSKSHKQRLPTTKNSRENLAASQTIPPRTVIPRAVISKAIASCCRSPARLSSTSHARATATVVSGASEKQAVSKNVVQRSGSERRDDIEDTPIDNIEDTPVDMASDGASVFDDSGIDMSNTDSALATRSDKDCHDRSDNMETADKRSQSQSGPAQTNLVLLRDALGTDQIQQILENIKTQGAYQSVAKDQRERAQNRETVLSKEYDETSGARKQALRDRAGDLDDPEAWGQGAMEETDAAFKERMETIERGILETTRKRRLADRALEADGAKRARLDRAAQDVVEAMAQLKKVAEEEMPSLAGRKQ